MQFQIPFQIKNLQPPIDHQQKIMLVGSCFTEHIGNWLSELKFHTLQNPNGILFNPISVCDSIKSYLNKKQYQADELFYFNEGWHSWQHHSCFSHPDKSTALKNINDSQTTAASYIRQADWLVITLGSAFVYHLQPEGFAVANCHKAPAQRFVRTLCTIDEITAAFDDMLYRLFQINNTIKILFTISPVRHIREGVIENNRSKARLIEVVHHLVNKFNRLHYFPAYELVIDVLRDYRFYDIDMVHPNYPATQFVIHHFKEACITPASQQLCDEIKKIVVASKHKAFNPSSQQHKSFLEAFYQKTKTLQSQYPQLDFSRELQVFNVNA